MVKLVSVIIPTYNRANTIVRAINSVLNQTYKKLEILVVDDASTENIEKIVRNFTDDRIKYIRHPYNKGGGAARNTGITVSRGEYIAFLDSDDEWLPEKIEKQLNVFHKSTNSLGVVYTGFQYVNEYGQMNEQVIPKERGNISLKILEWNYVGTASTVLARSDFLKRINGFDETLPSCQDWDLYIRLSKICLFDFVAESLVRYTSSRNLTCISNKKEAVILGHNKILEKYNINNVARGIKAMHYYNRGVILLYNGSDTKRAFFSFIKAFYLTLNIKYLKGVILIFRKILFKI
jgi:glycosyltransferase involved in cell wall biosynthesis